MIDLVIVFDSLKTGVLTSFSLTCKDMKEVEEHSKWYFENRHVKNLYITFRGEKNEKN